MAGNDASSNMSPVQKHFEILLHIGMLENLSRFRADWALYAGQCNVGSGLLELNILCHFVCVGIGSCL